ncbi:flippase [Halosolutus gelatinilyticus]|uniref:flippase n=1 Tax=Halosolutus gelatinilyticus TaxID=2931975 RepID=UPI001FF65B80|nr:flippase [Halosolutus gelatinilyticus]
MSIGERISRGLKATLGANLLTVAANGVLSVVLARFLLAPDEYGLLFFALAVFNVVMVFGTLGLPSSVARYVAEYGEGAPEQVPHIITASLAVLFGLTAIVGAIVSLGSPWIATALEEPGLEPLLALGFGYVVLRGARTYLAKVFQGFNRVDYSAAVNSVFAVGHVIFAIGFVLLGFGVVGAFAGYLVGLAVAVALGLVILYVGFYRTFERAPQREEGLLRRILEYSVPLTATRSANVIDKQIDTILVGVLLNPTAVAYYTITKQVTSVTETPAKALGFTISPTYGEQKAAGQGHRAARLYERSLEHVLLLYVPAVVGLVLVADPMVRYVFGPEYLGAVPVLQVLSVYVLLSAINNITSDGLDYLGRARDRAIVKSTTAGANFGLNLLLIPVWGVVGAGVATVLTFSVYTGANVYIISRELPIRYASAARTLVGVTGVSLVMGLGVYALRSFVTGPATLLGVIGFGVLVWVVGTALGGLLDVRRTVRFLT